MSVCSDCDGIVQRKRGAAGHDKLISLGYVRSLGAAKSGAKHEAFVCSVCGTEWDYFHDRRDEAAGWVRC